MFDSSSSGLEEVLLEDLLTDIGQMSQLIVYNDDYNTF